MSDTLETSLPTAPAFEELMALRGQGLAAAGEAAVTGRDPFHPTPFRVGDTTAAVLAAVGVAANDIWQQRTGRRQQVRVSQRHAAATVRTVDYTRARNAAGAYEHVQIPQAMAHMLKVTQPWPTRDGRWFLPHLNLPHLSQRVLEVLQCESTPEAVRAAVARWDADALEDAIAAARAPLRNGWRIPRAAISRAGPSWKSIASARPPRPRGGPCRPRGRVPSPASACWTSPASSPAPWPAARWPNWEPTC